jgi:hypothetical protein
MPLVRKICTLLIETLILSVAGCSLLRGPEPPAAVPELVGLQHPPLPDTYADVGGFLLGEFNGMEYALTEVADPTGQHMVWLDRMAGRNPFGQPQWEIRAILTLPALSDGQEIAFVDCDLDGQADTGTFAIGTWKPRHVLEGVRHAWRANAQAERFDVLPTERVWCGYNENEDRD